MWYRMSPRRRARRGGILIATGALMVVSTGFASAAETTAEEPAASVPAAATPRAVTPPAPTTSAGEDGPSASSEPGTAPAATAASSDAPKATEDEDAAGTEDAVETAGTEDSGETAGTEDAPGTAAPVAPVETEDTAETQEAEDAAEAEDTAETAAEAAAAPEAAGDDVPYARTMSRFLHAALRNIETYWEDVFVAEKATPPLVDHYWVRPGETIRTSCGSSTGPEVADDKSALYCGGDDTIYLGSALADYLVATGGTFGPAIVLAHEYAHNIQEELGIRNPAVRPLKEIELQADCLGGVWANAAHADQILDDAALAGARTLMAAAADEDHGTAEERVTAWTVGFTGGAPGDCGIFLPTDEG